MFCEKCSSDSLAVVRTIRGMKFDPERRKWSYSDSHDVRRVNCLKCGFTFLTVTSFLCEVKVRPDGTSSVPPLSEDGGLFQ